MARSSPACPSPNLRELPPPPGDAEAFIEGVYEVVLGIPPGRVMSYGQVAAHLGSRASRQVGKIMSRHGHELPWWRVIRADGSPPAGHEERARAHYAEEGTALRESVRGGYRVARAAFVP
ncbi:MGMT family protein [Mycetocola spongiae]|nr:MGMT family protein [Mycetocola spongiae]